MRTKNNRHRNLYSLARLAARRLVFVALAALLLIGCTDHRSPEEMKDTLVFGFAENLKTFDPVRQIYAQESAIIMQVLQPLVRWNQDLELEPCLAVSWEASDDCATWTFHLRPDVYFHDGTPFTSEAVQFHFMRHLDPAIGSTRRSRVLMIQSVETPDPLTAVFHLDPPNCIFPEILSATAGHIPSPAAVKKRVTDPENNPVGEFGLHPVGTGPFEFVEWIPDVRVELKRNERYWNREEILLERLIFIPVPENTTRLILLEQGVLDIAPVSYQQVKALSESKAMSLQSAPQLSIRYIGMNTQKPPFNDPRVRRALNYAVNKEEIIEYVFFGVGEPARGPLPDVMPDYNPEIPHYDYNPELAKQLLAEAGYPKGYVAQMWTTETGSYRDVADAARDYWKRIGVDVKMHIIDNAAYWDKFDAYLTRDGQAFPTKEGVYDIYIGGWVGGESPDGFLQPLFSSLNYSNSSFYANPKVDELIKTYRNETDAMKRRESYRELQRIIVEDAPWVFAFHGQITMGVRPRVKNFKVNPAGWYFFEGVTVEDGQGGGGEAKQMTGN